MPTNVRSSHLRDPPTGSLVRLVGLSGTRRRLNNHYAFVTSSPTSSSSSHTDISVFRLPYSDGDEPITVPLSGIHPPNPNLHDDVLDRYSTAIVERALDNRFSHPKLVIAETATLLSDVELPSWRLASLLVLRGTALRTAGQHIDAISAFRRVTSPPLCTAHLGVLPDAHAELALTLANIARPSEALDEVEKLQQVAKRPEVLHANPGTAKSVERGTEGVFFQLSHAGDSLTVDMLRRSAELMLNVSPNHSMALSSLAALLRTTGSEADRRRAGELSARFEAEGELTETFKNLMKTTIIPNAEARTDPLRPPGTLVQFNRLTSDFGRRLNGRFGIIVSRLNDSERLPVRVIPISNQMEIRTNADDVGPFNFQPRRLDPVALDVLPSVEDYLWHAREAALHAKTGEKCPELAAGILRTALKAVEDVNVATQALSTVQMTLSSIIRDDLCEGAEAAELLGKVLVSGSLADSEVKGGAPNAEMLLRGEMAKAFGEDGEISKAVDEVETLMRECPDDGHDYSYAFIRICNSILSNAVINDDPDKRRACDLMLRLQPDHAMAKQTVLEMDEQALHGEEARRNGAQ